MLYSATAIFRTSEGPLAGFSFAPSAAVGVHDLKQPVTILHQDQIVVVKKVEIHPPSNVIVLSTIRGWTTCLEQDTADIRMLAYSGLSRMIGAKKQIISNAEVEANAFMAAVVLSGKDMGKLNEWIKQLRFYEIRLEAMTKEEYRAACVIHKPFTLMTEKQLALWLYTLIVCLNRMGALFISKVLRNGEKVTTCKLVNHHYRDMMMFLIRCFGGDCTTRIRSSETAITLTCSAMSALLGELFRTKMKPSIMDMAAFQKIVPREYVEINSKGQAKFRVTVDNSRGGCVEEVEVKPIPALIRAISFPELGNASLENNLLVVQHGS